MLPCQKFLNGVIARRAQSLALFFSLFLVFEKNSLHLSKFYKIDLYNSQEIP